MTGGRFVFSYLTGLNRLAVKLIIYVQLPRKTAIKKENNADSPQPPATDGFLCMRHAVVVT